MMGKNLGGKNNSSSRKLTPLIFFVIVSAASILFNDHREFFSLNIPDNFYQLTENRESLVCHYLASENKNVTDVTKQNNGEFTPERCETLPVTSVDTILWGAGEGDQVNDIVGAFFIARRLGMKLIEQDLRKSFSDDPKTNIWKAMQLSELLNYCHPVVNEHIHRLNCSSCSSSLWEGDIRNTCMCRSRYMKGGVTSIFRACGKSHIEFKGGARGFEEFDRDSIKENQSLFLRRFDPCGLQRGALFCPWLKEDLGSVGPGFFVSSYPGLRQFDGSNATCAHLRIDDRYMKRVADGLDIRAMKAAEVIDDDNFGCCYHTLREGKCSWDERVKQLSFLDYVRTIYSKTSGTGAPDLYFMAPPGISWLVRPLAAEYGVKAHFLEDFMDESTFRGSVTHADKIQCASSSIFAGTKSSFSNTVKMMRGYRRWVWLHQYYNMSAVTVDVDREFYSVEDWEKP